MKSQILHKVIVIQIFLLAVLWFGMPAAIEAVSHDSSATDTNPLYAENNVNPLRSGNAVGVTAVDTQSPLEANGSYQVFLPLVAKQGCARTIGLNERVADARYGFSDVSPGDIVCIEAGQRDTLVLRNFKGAPGAPIIFRNSGGQVTIRGLTGSGIFIQNSQHFRLTGSELPGIQYGIKIIGSAAHAIQIISKSSDFEIDHIEISGVPNIGVLTYTFATCSDGSDNTYDYDRDGKIVGDLDDVVTQDNFTQRNLIFHHLYIHDVGTEATYIGNSNARTLNCDSGPEERHNPYLVGVRMYNILTEDTGWEGLQVKNAISDCEIYDNVVRRYGLAEKQSQNTGILNGYDSVCTIRRNTVEFGSGSGIFFAISSATLTARIEDNLIIDAGQGGTESGAGIFVSNYKDGSVILSDNTIVNPLGKCINIKYGKGAILENNICR